jgi:hypothetical protein
VSIGKVNKLPICSTCLWRVTAHLVSGFECRASDSTMDVCIRAFEAGRRYERESLPFSEDYDPTDDLAHEQPTDDRMH